MLKPQDIVILLKILAVIPLTKNNSNEVLSQNKLALHLCMSVSEVHAGIKRLLKAGLLGEVQQYKNVSSTKKRSILPIKEACEEFLVSGIKYFFPGELGEYTRGIPTSYAAPIFKDQILMGHDPVPVWPYAEGTERGVALQPLYTSVPKSISQYPDPLFYELLALIDAIRSGRIRERNIATKLLKEKLDDQ